MPENELPNDPIMDALPADDSIVPESPDFQLAESNDDAATVPPGGPAEARSLVQEPRWPHPSFGWALLWCLLLWIAMQMSGAIVAVLVLAAVAILSPDRLPLEKLDNPQELFKTDAMKLGLTLGQSFAEIFEVAFAWLVIRLVVGKDWPRQLAVRRPGLAHTLLVLASLPAVALLSNVSYLLMRQSRWVPSISDASPLYLFYFWAAVFVVLSSVVLASWLFFGFGWTRRLAARPTRPADILIAAAVVPVLVLGVLVLYGCLHEFFRAPSLEGMKIGGMEEMTEIFGKLPLGFAVLIIGVGPGVAEELWCRGFLGRGLVGSHGAVVGVLATSFLFGLIHTDPCQGTMAMIAGLWLHFVYLSTRSLLLPVLLHFLNNSLNVLTLHIPQLQLLDSKPQDIPVAVYLTGFLLLGGVAYALYQSRARLAARSPDLPLTWRPAFEGVEYPPDGSGMSVVHPPLSPFAALLTGGAFMLFVGACVSWISHS